MDHPEDFSDNPNPNENEKENGVNSVLLLKKAASPAFLTLFLYLAVPITVILILEFALLCFMGTEAYSALADQIWFTWVLGVGIPYLIGIPIVCIFAKKYPVKKRETHSLSFSGFLIFLAIGWAAMLAGSIIGTEVNSLLEKLLRHTIINSTANLIAETPIWLIFLIVVIIGPIVEEYLYRKFLIDRLSPFGDGFAILVSAMAFALFHGNLYQLFYAFGIGLVLGYLYVKTGKMRYNIAMHMSVNFFGSIVAIPVQDAAERLSEMNGYSDIAAEKLLSAYLDIGLVLSYELISFGLAIVGVILFFRMKHSLRIKTYPEISMTTSQKGKGMVNIGVILFAVLAALQIVSNLF